MTSVWVYSKGAEPYRKGTNNFGAEKHYYGEPNSPADKAITDFENSIQGKIHELRNAEQGQVVDSAFAAHLICHLETRTRFLRNELSDIMNRMFRFLEEQFSDAQKVREMLLSYMVANPETLDDHLGQQFLSDENKEAINELALSYIANLSDKQAVETFVPFQNLILSNVKTTMQLAKDAHNKAVLKQGDETERWKAHSQMTFSIVKSERTGFVLPDTTLAFLTVSGATSFSQKNDSVLGAIIPVSSDTAIVGSITGEPMTNTKTINRVLASCSYEAFIGYEVNSFYLGLRGRIGKHAKLVSERDLLRIFNYQQLLNW